ncbi:histidine kinase [Streptomyces sp. NPDC059650]|uniref:sensor histidine kinase n=1 Tax=Streptomyces sp. NPDC059650 TaxID=3346896 RepID=UPI0036D0823B
MPPLPASRRRSVDVTVVMFAVCLSVALAGTAANPLLMFPRVPLGTPSLSAVRVVALYDPWFVFVDAGSVVCAGAACALWWRRRFPVAVAVLTLVLGLLSPAVTVSAMVALFTAAALRPVRVTAWLAAAAAVPVAVAQAWRGTSVLDPVVLGTLLVAWTLVALSVGWGRFVRSRRKREAALTERARRADQEATRRTLEAQQRAREDIAREMHDVLAHRLSLLSVHAGALELNSSPDPADLGRAAGVIRESAHQALEDLRTVIGLLRTPGDRYPSLPPSAALAPEAAPETHQETSGGALPEAPQPSLADLGRLADESRAAGMRLHLDVDVEELATTPALAGRTVFRIVQEGLTNARKHAPGAPVYVEVSGGRGAGLDIIVRNPAVPSGPSGSAPYTGGPASSGTPGGAIPGSAQGLIGLAERAALAGGELRHGPSAGDFLLQAWIPWPA